MSEMGAFSEEVVGLVEVEVVVGLAAEVNGVSVLERDFIFLGGIYLPLIVSLSEILGLGGCFYALFLLSFCPVLSLALYMPFLWTLLSDLKLAY